MLGTAPRAPVGLGQGGGLDLPAARGRVAGKGAAVTAGESSEHGRSGVQDEQEPFQAARLADAQGTWDVRGACGRNSSAWRPADLQGWRAP